MTPVPPGDYYAFASRASRRPVASVYAWMLREPMPRIAIPLAGSDPDQDLDLQAVFNGVYDRAGNDYTIHYDLPVVPPLGKEDEAWVREVLAARSTASPPA